MLTSVVCGVAPKMFIWIVWGLILTAVLCIVLFVRISERRQK